MRWPWQRRKPLLHVDVKRLAGRMQYAQVVYPGLTACLDEAKAASRDLLEGSGVNLANQRDRQLVAAGLATADFVFDLALRRQVIDQRQHEVVAILLGAVLSPVVGGPSD